MYASSINSIGKQSISNSLSDYYHHDADKLSPNGNQLNSKSLFSTFTSYTDTTNSNIVKDYNNNHHRGGSSGGSSDSICSLNKWLAIGIPTVARTHDEDYLMKSIDAIADQLPADPSDLLYNKVIIHIINMQVNANPNHRHIIFDQVRSKYSSPNNIKSQYFIFTEIEASDILPDLKQNTNAVLDHGDANHPGYLVRRQTRNIVTVIRKSLNLAQYYLFLEDDMQICPNGLLAIQYLLNKATRYHQHWMAIRASYGEDGCRWNDDEWMQLPFYHHQQHHNLLS